MIFDREERNEVVQDDTTEEKHHLLIIETVDDPHPGKNTHEITILDINDTGMGIICEFHLKVEQVVYFTDEQSQWDLPDQGLVVWTFKTDDGYRAGIKFI